MNTWKDAFELDMKSRIKHDTMSNKYLVNYIKNNDWENYVFDEDDKKAIRDLMKGNGKIVAIAKVKDTYAGNDSYVLFTLKDDKYFVMQYSKLNGAWNEMGPYVSLNTAESNADTYGLFQECVNDVVLDDDFPDDADTGYVNEGNMIF